MDKLKKKKKEKYYFLLGFRSAWKIEGCTCKRKYFPLLFSGWENIPNLE